MKKIPVNPTVDADTLMAIQCAKGDLKRRYTEAASPEARWQVIREFYSFMQPRIDAANHRRWAVSYDLPIHENFTPIEFQAWQCLRPQQSLWEAA